MMQLLDAMGLKVWQQGCKRPDPANPWGYWEDDRCNRKDFAWLHRENGAVKCLWPHVFEMDRNGHLFILMERDAQEVMDSAEEHFEGWLQKVDIAAEQKKLRAFLPQALIVPMKELFSRNRLAVWVNTIEDLYHHYLSERRTKITPVFEAIHA